MADGLTDEEVLLRTFAEDLHEHLSNTCELPPDYAESFEVARKLRELVRVVRTTEGDPIPMILTCPSCGERHIDEGAFASKRHHTHACQACGMVWRPAVVATVGVRFLPGFKNGGTE